MQCLGQELNSQDLVIFQVHSIPSTLSSYYVRVYDPLLTLQYSEKHRATHKFSQAVEHTGRYQVCVDNLSPSQDCTYLVKITLDAPDKHKAMSKKKIAPVEESINALNSALISILRKQNALHNLSLEYSIPVYPS